MLARMAALSVVVLLALVGSARAEPILSASFTGDFAALTAHRTLFGFEVNRVWLTAPGFALLDLSDALFGAADFPNPPLINMAPQQTGLVTVPIPVSFFPALEAGIFGLSFLFTDTDDGLFAIDFLSVDVTTASGTFAALRLDANDGFKIGIPDNGMLPSPLPSSLPPGATGTGFDESISSKSGETVVPEPATLTLLAAGLALLATRRRCRQAHVASGRS